MKFICNNCKGTGRVYDHIFGIFTMGFGYLVQSSDYREKDICKVCRGVGYLKK